MAFRKPTDQNRVKFNSFADHIEPNFRRNFSLPSIEEGFVLRPTYFAIAQNLANELKAIQFLVVEDEFFALPDFDQRCFVFSQSCWCTIPHLAPSHWGFLSVDGHRSRRLIVGVVDGALLPLPPWFEDIVAPSTDAARGSDNEVEHPVLDEAGAATTSSTPTPRCDERELGRSFIQEKGCWLASTSNGSPVTTGSFTSMPSGSSGGTGSHDHGELVGNLG